MRDRVEQEEYQGYKINIYQDDCTESPEDWGDDNLFLVGYHRDFYVDNHKKITKELARTIANNGIDEDGETSETAKDYMKKYHIFGLEAYIHSGVSLALSHEGNFPDRQWDVSQLGLVFVSKKEWRLRASARKAALGLIETWNDYLSGAVYGYLIENPDGEESGGCWGFWGYDYEKSGLMEAAKGEIEEEEVENDVQKTKIAKQIS